MLFFFLIKMGPPAPFPPSLLVEESQVGLHINFSRKFPMKECILDIHLIRAPIMNSNNNQKTTHSNEFHDQGKGLDVVDPLPLCKYFGNKSCLILFNGVVRMILNFEDIVATNGFVTRRKGNHSPCISSLKNSKICLHCFNPLKILTILLIREWFNQVRDIMHKCPMSRRDVGIRNIPIEWIVQTLKKRLLMGQEI